jgi:HEAT repeat protein
MRRRAFELLVAEPSVEDVVLLERCLESADTLIRFGAARELCKRLEGAALAEMLERLWTNRSMPLRREALYATLKRMPEVAVARLREALVDTNVSIREMGRSYLREKRENPSENFAEYYGRRLGNAHGAELEGTILGLGETGKDVDAQRVEEFLKHASARVRRAAVRAVARLDIERYGEWVMNALGDEAVTVTRAARDVLLAAPRVLCGKKLWEIVEGTESIEVRRSALSLIAELQWWESASLLLKALRLNDETRGLALSHLEGWQYNAHRLMVMPSWEQVELIEDGLKRHGAQLSKALREDLESLIAYVRREKVRWR